MEEFNFNKSKSVLVLVIVIVLISFIVFYNLKIKAPKSNSIPTQIPLASVTSTPSLEVVRNTLLANAKIKFPNVTSSSVISINQLPKELSVFLLDNSTNVSLKTVKYANGAKGYQVEYITNLPWQDSNNKFVSLAYPLDRSSWRILSGSLAELFAFVEMENNHYQVRVDQTFNNNRDALISIQIISK